LQIPYPSGTKSKVKTAAGSLPAPVRLLRNLILLPPCIVIGLLGALMLQCPSHRAKKRG